MDFPIVGGLFIMIFNILFEDYLYLGEKAIF